MRVNQRFNEDEKWYDDIVAACGAILVIILIFYMGYGTGVALTNNKVTHDCKNANHYRINDSAVIDCGG
jgi:hypothetical protein